jgi:hypothetical protein
MGRRVSRRRYQGRKQKQIPCGNDKPKGNGKGKGNGVGGVDGGRSIRVGHIIEVLWRYRVERGLGMCI